MWRRPRPLYSVDGMINMALRLDYLKIMVVLMNRWILCTIGLRTHYHADIIYGESKRGSTYNLIAGFHLIFKAENNKDLVNMVKIRSTLKVSL